VLGIHTYEMEFVNESSFKLAYVELRINLKFIEVTIDWGTETATFTETI
jgi:hypothetical protein